MVETTFIKTLITAIKENTTLSDKLKTIGFYPYDIDKVTMNMPAILFKLGDIEIQNMGHTNFYYTYHTQIILYYDNFKSIQPIQDALIPLLLDQLNNINCMRQIEGFSIQSGDVNEYMLPSTTGYNANIVVRTITLDYTINRHLT